MSKVINKLNKYGIKLKNEKGEYLTIEEVLSQCYTIWDKCTERQKREIMEAFGVLQTNPYKVYSQLRRLEV